MAARTHVWVATLGTRHYDWIAAGATEDEALDALRRTWDGHATEKSPVGRTVAEKRAWMREHLGARTHELALGEGKFQ